MSKLSFQFSLPQDNCEYIRGDLRGSASVLMEVCLCQLSAPGFFLLSNITVGDTQEMSAL